MFVFWSFIVLSYLFMLTCITDWYDILYKYIEKIAREENKDIDEYRIRKVVVITLSVCLLFAPVFVVYILFEKLRETCQHGN